jgi:Holliday junction resolvase RusA-like endonuclease
VITVYPITPVPAPRQVRKDAYNPSPMVQRYRAFRDEVAVRHVQLPTPYHHVIFVLPMSTSWPGSKRAKLLGMPHQFRPDRDNLEKALLDSVFGEDSHVWDGRSTKLWGGQGLIIISDHDIPITLPFDLRPYVEAIRKGHPIAGLVPVYPVTI